MTSPIRRDPDFDRSLRNATLVRPVDARDASSKGMGDRPHWVDGLKRIREAVRIVELAGNFSDMTFLEVLDMRTSVLETGALDQDSAWILLDLLSRTRHSQEDAAGRVWRSKLFPSAGGVHSIEPLLYVNLCDDLSPGWYRRGISGIDEVVLPAQNLLKDCLGALRSERLPAAILFAASEPRWIEERYPGGESLLWRDAGVFLGLAQLIATALGQSSTLLGSVSLLSDTSLGWPVGTLGALAIGGRKEA